MNNPRFWKSLAYTTIAACLVALAVIYFGSQLAAAHYGGQF